jgi:cyclophilin family peptidyl-prolyl cis-trans isomerase
VSDPARDLTILSRPQKWSRTFLALALITTALITTSRLTMLKALGQQPAAGENPASLEAVVTTELGIIRFEFYPDKAPKHVQQFIKLARQGFYDGSAFHRVMPQAIIQGGDPLLKNEATQRELWGTGGLNQTPDEPNDLKHMRGTISTVAIPGKPDSGGAQFFICMSPQPQLDGHFSAFGRVTEGIDVVDKISQVPTDDQQITVKPVRILSIRIEPKPVPPFKDATVQELKKDVLLHTSLGDITVRMDPEVAPETVRNFLTLVKTGWYDHTAFHRVIAGFVIQGGLGNTRAGGAPHLADRWVHDLKPEFSGRLHVRGVLSMARGAALDSASTSFFIVLGPAPHLDGKYAVFGKVVAGIDVLSKFEGASLAGEEPLERIELISATIKD